MNQADFLSFPKDFIWGTATSAYQIEGAVGEGGRGQSVWDCFAATPGAIADGKDGSVACDHYHLWRDDLDLMATLGLRNYRFSIAWPRILPSGTGAVNTSGLDFYDRLVDGMLERGIRPFATLFHWDLPQALESDGGWTSRSTVDAFVRYTDLVVRRLGDRVKDWMTHNEPWVVAFCGHLFGVHAPGYRDLTRALAVAHGILLSHGLAVRAIRAQCAGARVGIVQNLEWVESASERPEDQAAALRHDGAFNRWFLDPIFGRGYPGDMAAWYDEAMPHIEPGDLAAIAAPLDFLGVNYYTRRIIACDPAGRGRSGREVFAARQIYRPFSPRADFDEWEVAPEGLYRLIMRLEKEYHPPSIIITENGTSSPDQPDANEKIQDVHRIRYIARHAAAVRQAISDGVDVAGYFLWSFLDNFEWGFGFSKRFGMIYVDYESQRRSVKNSGYWFSTVARDNGFPFTDATTPP